MGERRYHTTLASLLPTSHHARKPIVQNARLKLMTEGGLFILLFFQSAKKVEATITAGDLGCKTAAIYRARTSLTPPIEADLEYDCLLMTEGGLFIHFLSGILVSIPAGSLLCMIALRPQSHYFKRLSPYRTDTLILPPWAFSSAAETC